MRVRIAVALLLLSNAVVPAVAQPPARCDGHACTPADIQTGVNELQPLKVEFVDALRRFAEAISGSYGDEGSRLPSALEALQRALESWDRAIAGLEVKARTAGGGADVHVALGSVYLERARVRDALTEFAAAARADPRRADVHVLTATAFDLTGDAANATSALEKAAAVVPRDLATAYRLAKALAGDQSPKASAAQARVDALHLALPEIDGAPLQFERVGLLRQAPGVAPIFPPQRYVAAFRLIDRGRYAEAVTALRAAIADDPLGVGAPAGTASAAGARLRRGQLQAALTELRGAPAQSTDAETVRVSGLAYWADEQYERSIDAFTAAVRMNPRDERARIALADVFVAAGRPADAKQLLKETIALLPESGQAHYRLARLYQSESLVSDAAAAFEQAAACFPLVGLDYLHDTLGGLYAIQADFDRAVAAYRRRIDVNPNSSEAHRKLGEIYALQGRDDAALAEFAVAQRLDRQSAEALADAAQAYLRLNRFADAVRLSQQALALDPMHQKARFTLGTSLVRLGRAADGQRELDLVQHEIDDTASTRRRALEASTLERDAAQAERAGDYPQAASFLQRALDLTPGNAQVEFDLGRMLVKAGRAADALAHLAKAGESEDRAEVHQIAAEAYAALGQPDARAREETRFRQLVQQRKEERLKSRPLLR
jgi:tetratricopeptide (TPR) repeat protein